MKNLTNRGIKQLLAAERQAKREILPPQLDPSQSTKPSLDEYDLCPAEANYGDRVHYMVKEVQDV